MNSTSTPLEHISLQAYTPDQILPYVHAVSSVKTTLEQDFLVHTHGSHAIVVGYALGADLATYMQANEQSSQPTQLYNHKLEKLLQNLNQQEHLERITLLAAQKSALVPSNALCQQDAYYFLALPLVKAQARNAFSMCRRALPHIQLTQDTGKEAWTGAHQELMLSYLQRQDVSKEMGSIFQRLDAYCRLSPHVVLFSAYDTHTGALMGMTLGDFSSLHTAFYMFAFRHPHAEPGVSEALLGALVQEAEARGYAWCNLGLGIHDGIRFFKEKWGARPLLSMVECSWDLQAQTPEHKHGHKHGHIQASDTKKSWWQKLWE